MKKIFLLLQILWGSMAIAQPTGSCTTGATQLGTDGILYGCVETNWRRLSELSTSTAAIPTTQGITQNVSGTVYVRETDNSVRDLKNVNYPTVTLTGQTHEIGKIVYDTTTKHFYQGVSGGKWHQIDNFYPTRQGQCTPYSPYGFGYNGWHYFPPNTLIGEYGFTGGPVTTPHMTVDHISGGEIIYKAGQYGVWLLQPRCGPDGFARGCNYHVKTSVPYDIPGTPTNPDGFTLNNQCP